MISYFQEICYLVFEIGTHCSIGCKAIEPLERYSITYLLCSRVYGYILVKSMLLINLPFDPMNNIRINVQGQVISQELCTPLLYEDAKAYITVSA